MTFDRGPLKIERIVRHLHCIINIIYKAKSGGPCARPSLTSIIDGILTAVFDCYCLVVLVDAHDSIEW